MSDAPLRVAFADADADTRRFLDELLPRLGCQVVASAAGGAALLRQLPDARPDLLITEIRMPDLDGIELARAANRERPVPVILVSAHSDTQLIARAEADYIVMAYLVKPVGEKDLRAAIPLAVQRFRQFQALAAEAATLRQSLEDRKSIERAKGTLMRRLRVEEEAAFRRMRLLASAGNRKLIEVAREVIAADEIFRALESVSQD